MQNDHFKFLRSNTRSLKTQLAIYFLPLAMLPVIGISYYATSVFEASSRESLYRRAISERDAISAEIYSLDSDLVRQVRGFSKSQALLNATSKKDSRQIASVLAGFRQTGHLRVYSVEGDYLGGYQGEDSLQLEVNQIAKDGLKKIKTNSETMDRYLDPKGIVFIARSLIRDSHRLYGILEEEYVFGNRRLLEIKNRRQLDLFFFSLDYTTHTGTMPLSGEESKTISKDLFQLSLKQKDSIDVVNVSDTRFGGYVFDLHGPQLINRKWGKLVVMLPLYAVDSTTTQLRMNIIYITVFLGLGFALLIVLFSRRIVRPIEYLVSAMKRVKTGALEELPPVESAYEIDYLVRAFNDMIRNVSAAKRTLESKLVELRQANEEIKNTQSTLVQSAKMISLGQLVAGVAHELNNPIAFIYSNMHHLQEYVEKIKKLVASYHEFRDSFPPATRKQIEKIESDLEVEYILKDIEDLSRSCLDGANRTKEIVLGLRTFSRMDESSFKVFDIHEGIRSTLKLLAAELKNRVTVHEEFQKLPFVEANQSQLNQVFMNLLSNASHALGEKGDIWIRTRAVGKNIEVEIEDNGVGMAHEVVEKIFDPFFTTKKVGQGTGLGLSIAYGLIKKHQGDIRVESTIGKGTKFTVTLPIEQTVRKAG